MNRFLIAAAILAASLSAGCSSSPTQPVVTIELSSLTLSPDADTLIVGDQALFTAVALDTAGVPVADPALQWTSGNTAVFSVSRSGRVTALNEGTARLYVSGGGQVDSALVVVLPAVSGWFAQGSGVLDDLNGVFFLPDGNRGWAVGSAGRIITTATAGRTWAVQSSGTAFELNAVWFSGPSEGWAVGANGTVLHTANGGAIWQRLQSGTSNNLLDVAFATPDTGWVAGSGGIIMTTFDGGATWRKSFPTAYTLRGVSFAGTRDGWAVGDNGVIAGTHDRGLNWFIVQPSVTGSALRSVSRRSAEFAVAVGAAGASPHTVAGPDSVVWENRNLGSLNQLEDVFFPTDLTGFAVGINGVGAVLRTTDGGLNWTAQTPNVQFRLNDVFFIDANRGWAVGENGTIVHTANGGAP